MKRKKIFHKFPLKITDKGFEAEFGTLDTNLNEALSEFFANPDHIPSNIILEAAIDLASVNNIIPTIVYSSWILCCNKKQYPLNETIGEFCENQFYDLIMDKTPLEIEE